LPSPLVIRSMDQLLRVLTRAHARGIVHRDIKPDNLFLTQEGLLKVLDFGIARAVEQFPGATVETHAGLVLGTPAFMPHEQARGLWNEVDARSDLWATAATMFTLLCGRYVHGTGTSNELLGRAMTGSAPPLSSVCAHASAELARVVDQALSFDKEARFATAAALQLALRACPEACSIQFVHTVDPDASLPESAALGEAQDKTLGYSGAMTASQARTRPRRRITLLALALLGVAGLGLTSIWTRPKPVTSAAARTPSSGASDPARSAPAVSADPPRTATSPPPVSEVPLSVHTADTARSTDFLPDAALPSDRLSARDRRAASTRRDVRPRSMAHAGSAAPEPSAGPPDAAVAEPEELPEVITQW
jgi:serine/threonine protein kinase